jgi:hypothetical protein
MRVPPFESTSSRADIGGGSSRSLPASSARGETLALSAPFLVALLFLVTVVGGFEKWLYSNEVFNALSMGLIYSPEHPGLLHLRDAALDYCRTYAQPAEVRGCEYYQNSISERLAYAHPLTAVIGLQTRALLSDRDWLLKLQHIALEPLLISGALAIALWLFVTLKLPRPERQVGVAVTLCLLLIAQSRSDQYRLIPDPILDVGSWWTFLTLAGVAAASFILTSGFPLNRLRMSRWDDRLANRVFLTTAVVAFALSLALPPAANALLGPLALIVFLCLLAWLSLEKTLRDIQPLTWATLTALLFVAATADSLWFMRRLIHAREYADLIYLALIGLVTVRPRTWVVWLMPALAVFHVPAAALISLATLTAEGIICLRRLRISMLLGSSALTFAIAFAAIKIGIESVMFSPDTARPMQVTSIILQWPGLLPALISLALVVILAGLPLLRRDDSGDGFARAGLLIAGGLAATISSAAVLKNNPSLLNAPGFALITKNPDYLVTALLPAGALGMILGLSGMSRSQLRNHADSQVLKIRRMPASIWAAMLLLLAVSKMDLSVRDTYLRVPDNIWRYLIADDLNADWCRSLSQIRLDDETYVLSRTNPTNDPITYMSALKLRLRIQAGLYDDSAFSVIPAEKNSSECKPGT